MKKKRRVKNDLADGCEVAAGVAWYRPEQWQRLREISVDQDTLEESHGEWLKFASKTFEEVKCHAANLVKVDVDTEELLAWCRSRSLPVNAEARSQFVMQKVQRAHETGGQLPETLQRRDRDDHG